MFFTVTNHLVLLKQFVIILQDSNPQNFFFLVRITFKIEGEGLRQMMVFFLVNLYLVYFIIVQELHGEWWYLDLLPIETTVHVGKVLLVCELDYLGFVDV